MKPFWHRKAVEPNTHQYEVRWATTNTTHGSRHPHVQIFPTQEEANQYAMDLRSASSFLRQPFYNDPEVRRIT